MAAINGYKIVACVYHANHNGGAGGSLTPFTKWERLHDYMQEGAERYGYVYTYAGTRDGAAVFTEQHRRQMEKEIS